MVQVIQFDTDDYPPETRAALVAAARTDFHMAPLVPPEAYRVRATIIPLGRAVINESHFEPTLFERSAERAKADGMDQYSFQMLFSGSARGEADGTAIEFGPGEPFLLDLTRPSRFEVHNIHAVGIRFERAFLEEAMPPVDVHGLLPVNAYSALLGDMLRPAMAALPQMDAAGVALVATQLRDLVAGCAAALPGPVRRTDGRSLRARASSYIRQHLAEPLDIDALCRTLGASRSSLYRAFGNSAGVVAFVRRRRLACAHRALMDPRTVGSIGEVARRCGFPDPTQFSRLFRAEFGYSARELRQRRLTPAVVELTHDEAVKGYVEAMASLDGD